MSAIEIVILAYLLGPILVTGLILMPRLSARFARKALHRRRMKAEFSADWWSRFEHEFRLYARNHSQRRTPMEP